MRAKGAQEQLGLDVGALAALIHRLAREEIARLARGQIDPDDMAQDCACEIHGRGLCPPAGSPVEAWLRLFVRHRVQQEVERVARRAVTPLLAGLLVRADQGDPVAQDWPPFAEQFTRIEHKLPVELRGVVALLAYRVAVPEIAQVLALPLPVVRGRARRAGWVLHERGAQGASAWLPIGPPTVAEFLVARRREGHSVAEAAHAAGIGLSWAKKLLRRSGASRGRSERAASDLGNSTSARTG